LVVHGYEVEGKRDTSRAARKKGLRWPIALSPARTRRVRPSIRRLEYLPKPGKNPHALKKDE
jgi:hypothetical protein